MHEIDCQCRYCTQIRADFAEFDAPVATATALAHNGKSYSIATQEEHLLEQAQRFLAGRRRRKKQRERAKPVVNVQLPAVPERPVDLALAHLPDLINLVAEVARRPQPAPIVNVTMPPVVVPAPVVTVQAPPPRTTIKETVVERDSRGDMVRATVIEKEVDEK